MPAVNFLLFTLSVVLSPVAGYPCVERPDQAVVQLTEETCTCCSTFEEKIQLNEYVCVLFYKSRHGLSLSTMHHFDEVASKWRWWRVGFGRVDVEQDPAVAKKWMIGNPNSAPTIVMFKFGKQLRINPEDMKVVKDKYQANAEGFEWLFQKYFGVPPDNSNLRYVTSLKNAKRLNKFVNRHKISIVGYFNKESDPYCKIFMESAWKLFQDGNNSNMVSVASMSLAGEMKKQKDKQEGPAVLMFKKTPVKVRSIVAYLEGIAVQHIFGGDQLQIDEQGKAVQHNDETADKNEKWTTASIVDYMRLFVPETENENTPSEKTDSKTEL